MVVGDAQFCGFHGYIGGILVNCLVFQSWSTGRPAFWRGIKMGALVGSATYSGQLQINTSSFQMWGTRREERHHEY